MDYTSNERIMFHINRQIDNVEIVGKIDRLDVAKTENAKYIRIIDYKSSDKNIDLNEFISGTQIQLITYLDSVVSEKENKLPAGMLYFKMIDPIIKSDKNKPIDDNKNENIEESKYIEEISVRYQLIGGGGIRMSGIDVEDMTKQVKEKSAKHKKK